MEFMKETLNQSDIQGNTLYDFIYNLVFFTSLKESEEDIKKGRILTVEESKEMLRREYKGLNI